MTEEIRHHLTDDLLLAYSAGTLPQGFALVVATHVSLCDECRARMQAYDALGGVIFEEAEEAEVADDSFARTMALIDKAPDFDLPDTRPLPGSVFPAPLREAAGGDLDRVHWRPVGGGVSQALLSRDGDASVRLLRIPGGTAVPDHGHRGMELTLVLQGAFADATDRFGAGDVEVADEELTHTPVAEPGAECICLAAADAPLRFSALLPRIAGRIMGI